MFSMAIALAFWFFLDPPEPIRISPETTIITEPIAEDGLPDFCQAMLDRQRKGVTPENNAAIEMWRAIGPAEIDAPYRDLLFREIGCETPSHEGVLEGLSAEKTKQRLAAWVARQPQFANHHDTEVIADAVAKYSQRYMWLAFPSPLIRWVEENRSPLGLLVKAGKKKRFYSPPPNFLSNPPSPVAKLLLPHAQMARAASRSLLVLSMRLVAEEEYESAFEVIGSSLMLGVHCSSGQTGIEQVVGIAIRSESLRSMHAWFSVVDDQTLLSAALNALSETPELDEMKEVLVFGEAFVSVDSVLRAISPERQALELDLSDKEGAIEPNVLLSEMVKWFDRLGKVAAIEDRCVRRNKAVEFELELEQLADDTGNLPNLFWSVLSRDRRSKTIADFYISLMMPMTSTLLATEDRCVAEQRMTLLAMACRLHFLENGEYPESFAALDPEVLEEIPLDPFSNRPFHYERRDDGFLIYSVGKNGRDDRANDERGDFLDGEHAPVDWFGDRVKPEGVDDLVVRIPVPPLELPFAKSAATE